MEKIKIAVVQSHLHWQNVDENLKSFSAKLSSITEPADLILLPEMFTTGFTMQTKQYAEPFKGSAYEWMQKTAAEKNAVLCGSISCHENGKYYNRLIWMQPDGNYFTYDKRHLFRYGDEQKHYTAGEKKLIVQLKGFNIYPLVCYDLRFPVWSRNKNNAYDLLLYIANWPERRVHAWSSLLVARAIENQAYVIGLNRVGLDGNNIAHSGNSAVINFKGELMSNITPHQESITIIELNKSDLEKWRADFPAWMDADKFTIE
jgi:predicted amidohydrolase